MSRGRYTEWKRPRNDPIPEHHRLPSDHDQLTWIIVLKDANIRLPDVGEVGAGRQVGLRYLARFAPCGRDQVDLAAQTITLPDGKEVAGAFSEVQMDIYKRGGLLNR